MHPPNTMAETVVPMMANNRIVPIFWKKLP